MIYFQILFLISIFSWTPKSYGQCQPKSIDTKIVSTNFFENFNERYDIQVSKGKKIPIKEVPKIVRIGLCPDGSTNCLVKVFNANKIPKVEKKELKSLSQSNHSSNQVVDLKRVKKYAPLGNEGAVVFIGSTEDIPSKNLREKIRESLISDNKICHVSATEDGKKFNIKRIPYVKNENNEEGESWTAYVYCTVGKCEEEEISCGILTEKYCSFSGELAKKINFGPACGCREKE